MDKETEKIKDNLLEGCRRCPGLMVTTSADNIVKVIEALEGKKTKAKTETQGNKGTYN